MDPTYQDARALVARLKAAVGDDLVEVFIEISNRRQTWMERDGDDILFNYVRDATLMVLDNGGAPALLSSIDRLSEGAQHKLHEILIIVMSNTKHGMGYVLDTIYFPLVLDGSALSINMRAVWIQGFLDSHIWFKFSEAGGGSGSEGGGRYKRQVALYWPRVATVLGQLARAGNDESYKICFDRVFRNIAPDLFKTCPEDARAPLIAWAISASYRYGFGEVLWTVLDETRISLKVATEILSGDKLSLGARMQVVQRLEKDSEREGAGTGLNAADIGARGRE